MKKLKARWFWLAWLLTIPLLGVFANPALFVLFNIISFSLFVIAIIKSIPAVKSFFIKKNTTPED